MKKKRSTKMSLSGIVLLLAAGLGALFFLLKTTLEYAAIPEPLAEARDLATLISGGELSQPPYEKEGEYLGVPVLPPSLTMLEDTDVDAVLAASTDDSKRIEVDLTNQKVYAFEGDRRIHEFLISSGKWFPTPTGEFRIWSKVRSQKMSGGSKALRTYYYLPNVPYVMFFSNDEIPRYRGFGFHGTYWHNNFGHPMSHGCVNMRTEDAKVLYEWANPVVTNPKSWSTLATDDNLGTRVIIYGVTPKS